MKTRKRKHPKRRAPAVQSMLSIRILFLGIIMKTIADRVGIEQLNRSLLLFASSMSSSWLHQNDALASTQFIVTAFSMPKQPRNRPPKSGSSKKKGGRGNQSWYEKRKAGIKVTTKGPKPPKWEREGDQLYINSNQDSGNDGESKSRRVSHKDITYEQATKLLLSVEETMDSSENKHIRDTTNSNVAGDEIKREHEEEEKPFMWGGLSVGPVWKSRLVRAGYKRPTPIQIASYTSLLNKKNQTAINGNAVIAAATGSGKSLAYLLPFLTSIDTNVSKKKKKSSRHNLSRSRTVTVTDCLGKIWIMTPTMELAYQLQRTVDNLIFDKNQNPDPHFSSNVLHVVEYNRPPKKKRTNALDSSQVLFSESYPILTDIIQRHYSIDHAVDNDEQHTLHHNQEPTFLAGTPKLFLQLRKELKKVLVVTAKLQGNLKYEKQREARRQREIREANSTEITGRSNISFDTDENTSVTSKEEQLLYREVALALQRNLQTLILDEVDRLLQTTTALSRREFQTTKPLAQELLETLVWEYKPKTPGRYGRTTSSPQMTKLQIVCASATIGRSLRRQLMYIVQAPSTDKAAALITADVRTKKNAQTRKASLLPSNLQHSYRLLMPPTKKTTDESFAGTNDSIMLESLAKILKDSERIVPSLVFPGKIGVEAVQDFLNETGFDDVRGLTSLRTIEEGSDAVYGCWKNAPVYVVKERLARGLDLPFVRRVVLMGVPNNAAAYAHLAGRTSRQNMPGECTVLFWPKETYKFLSISETLGLTKWKSLNNKTETRESCKDEVILQATDEREWRLDLMTKTDIKNTRVSELRSFLDSKNIPTKGLLKAALVDAVLSLKEGV